MDPSEYGAQAANTRFFESPAGGGADYCYLALRDHPGPSGVPLGGIGVGCFGLAPDGRFTRVALNNTFRPLPDDETRGCFFAVWQAASPPLAFRLVRGTGVTPVALAGFAHTTYRGLFPTARLSFDGTGAPDWALRVSLHAFSGLVPQNVKDSALPLVHFAVTLVNTNKQSVEAAVAFSWEDLIGRGLLDVPDLERMPEFAHWQLADAFTAGMRVPTGVAAFEQGPWRGLRQSAARPLRPKRLTFQNYVHEVALLAEAPPGVVFSRLPRYVPGSPAPSADDLWHSRPRLCPPFGTAEGGCATLPTGTPNHLTPDPGEAAWQGFRERGVFPDAAAGAGPLSEPDGPVTASAVAVRATLAPGEKRTFRFLLAWYMPELKPEPGAHPRSAWPGCDYGRPLHDHFEGVAPLAAYGIAERERLLREVEEWHRPILDSTLPDWLKFKLINSAYTLYPQTVLNRAGSFSVMEGEMGGLTGTLDQRLAAHPVCQKLFTALDRSEMQLFADAAGPEGNLLHFSGNYLFGLPAPGGPSPAPEGWMLDNTASWIIQLAKDYAQTGDAEYLRRNAAGVRRGLAFLSSKIAPGTEIPSGPTTYDDYPHPPVYAYMAGVYLATLRAGAALARAAADEALARECDAQFDRTRRAFVRLLWNGRCFAYGCELDGTRRRDDLVFTGQLAGQFLCRYCAWGDALPLEMTRAALVTQFQTALAHAPDYYANKLWDTELHMGVDMPGSQCWPFYLEAYTGMAAIQAGYLEDGLEILRRIQLVHLRQGYTWCQNLWNPGPVTYMSAPVTWFITDVLAGAGLDAPSGTLFLAPTLLPGQTRTRLPLFFPRFWASVEYAPAEGRASLRVLKTFGERPLVLRRLVSEPLGTPADARGCAALPPFTVAPGAELDLSPYVETFSRAVLHPAVLPRAGEVLIERIGG